MSTRAPSLRPGASTLATPPDADASAEHKRFRKLTQQIDQARRQLAAWHEHLPAFLHTHSAPTLSRVAALRATHLHWLHELDRLLGEKGWTQHERQFLEALRDANQPADLSEAPPEEASEDEGNWRQAKAPSKAQARQQAEAALSAQSLRSLYRKLASALHPDREPDPVKREARTALMQRVNRAHDQKDLLALLALQAETAQACADDATDTPEAQLKRNNQLLTGQLAQVQAELKHIERGFRLDFQVPPAVNLQPAQLNKVLALHLARLHHMQASLEQELGTFVDRAATKRWIKQEMARPR